MGTIKNYELRIKKEEQTTVDKGNTSVDRLRRIEGQIKGIEKMLTEKQDCIAVITQILAVRSALSSLAASILTNESCQVSNYPDKQQLQKLLTQLLEFKEK